VVISKRDLAEQIKLGQWHVCGRLGKDAEFLEVVKRRGHLQNLARGGEILLKLI
jgi:hypothetical protein